MNDWSEAEGRVELAYTLYESGKWAEALRELRAAVRINPYNSDWYYNMGLTLDAMNKYKEAVKAYQRALSLCPDDVETLTCLGVDCTQLERYKEALNYFEQAQQIDPDFEPCYCYRIATYSRMEQHDQAEQMFYLARQIKDKCPTCDFNIGESLFARGEYDRAIASWQQTLELEPDYPEVNARIAQAYWAKGDLDGAADYYRLALQDDPGDIDMLLDYGSMLMESQQLVKAGEKFNFVLELEPENLQARSYLADAVFLCHQPNRALHLLNEIIAEDAEYPLIHLRLAKCYLMLGQPHLARQHFLAECSVCPSDQLVLFSLADSLLALRSPKQAAVCLERLLEIAPDSAEAHQGLGRAYRKLGLLDKSAHHSRRALELNPELLDAHWNLALAHGGQLHLGRALGRFWTVVRLALGRKCLSGLARRFLH